MYCMADGIMYVCTYVCTYVCMYVCVYVCVFVDGVHIPASPFASPPTHTHRRLPSSQRQPVQGFLFRLTVGSRWVQIVGADCGCCMCHTRSVLGSIEHVLCYAGCVLCYAGCVLCYAGCVLCYAGCVLCKWSGLHSSFVLLSHRTRSDGFISLLSCRGVLTRPSNSLVSGRKREERGRERLGKEV